MGDDRFFHPFFLCNLLIKFLQAGTQFCSFFIINVYFILAFLIGLTESEDPRLIVRMGEFAVNIFLIKDLKVADMRALKGTVPVFIRLPVIKTA